MSDKALELELTRRLFYYRSAGFNFGTALDLVKQDCETIEALQAAESVAVTEMCLAFATKLQELTESFDYDDDDLDATFETFIEFEDLPEELATTVALAIDEAAAHYYLSEDNDENKDEDDKVVFNYEDWKNLSDAGRKSHDMCASQFS